MTNNLPRHKHFLKNRKGFSGIIAAIFIVLIVLFLYFNVFMFVLDRNTAFQDVSGQVQQMDFDRSNEQITVYGVNYNVTANQTVTASFSVNNISPLAVQIVGVWIKDLTLPSNQPNYGRRSVSIALQPGQSKPVTTSVTINGASANDSFLTWLITARGKTINTITYTPGVLAGFSFSWISNQKVNVPFTITITAKDAYGNTVTAYNGTNTLSVSTGTMSPTGCAFINGVWTGNITVYQTGTGVTISTSGIGSIGTSNSFDVTTTGVPCRLDGYNSSSSSGVYSMSIPSFNTAYPNDVIYLLVVERGSSVSPPIGTPPGLSSWTLRASVPFGSSCRLETWYAVKSSNGAVGSITINFQGWTSWAAAIAFGVSGANTALPFDVSTPPYNTGSGQSASVSITTSNANDIIIGALGVYCATTITNMNQWTNFTLITTITTPNGPPYLATPAEYQVVSTTQSGLVVGYYWNVLPYDTNWAMIADAIKKAP